MGKKISIDSATMMNKGLEVIEAYWLFDFEPNQIDIVIHPQSIIHSMVELKDKSIKAQMGVPDMKIPIQFALSYPRHFESSWDALNFYEIGSLTFEKPDLEKFPCIGLAYKALDKLGSSCAALNLANDHAVNLFLSEKINFNEIAKINEDVLENHPWIEEPSLEDILELGSWVDKHLLKY
jgi:1-deoxy-D-xylulose-5-phosphate reductoisomerase